MVKYREIDGGIEILNTDDFDPKSILDCGQVFRYKPTYFGYILYAGVQKVEIFCQKTIKIMCKDKNFLINYFDLNTDYAKIKLVLKKEHILQNAIEFGKGIRILKQQPLEMIISFIISANNNIPRIKGIIEKLCISFGEKFDDYYGFPTLEQLSKIDVEFFRNIGCGYRSEYLVSTIKSLQGFDLNSLYPMPTHEARKALMSLKGVGRKVADCILLFAYGKTDVFPADIWILHAYDQLNGKNNLSALKVSEYFSKRFGKYSGYAQQYMYYAKRENNIF